MGWFGHDAWAYLAYVPFAVLGLLLPYPRTGAWHVQAYTRGAAAACAGVAGLLTAVGAGSAFCFMLSFAASAPAAFLLSRVSPAEECLMSACVGSRCSSHRRAALVHGAEACGSRADLQRYLLPALLCLRCRPDM